MRILILGGSGFLGRSVMKKLLNDGHSLICLIRPGSEKKIPTLQSKIDIVPGDIRNPSSYRKALPQCDAVINLIGIIREFPKKGITFRDIHIEGNRQLIKELQDAGINRLLHTSAMGSHSDAKIEYYRSNFIAEEEIRNSGLDFTIFRPSILFGEEDRFLTTLAAIIRNPLFPFVPVIGDGNYLLQPVWVETVASGFAGALNNRKTIGQTFNVAGPDILNYNNILDTIGQVLGREVVSKMHIPAGLARKIARLFQGFASFPLTPDLITYLIEGNRTEHWRPYYQILNLLPEPFESGVRRILREKEIA